MSNLLTKYGKSQSGAGFLIVGKDSIKAFGVSKAVFISVLADIYDFSQKQGNERFFATIETLKEKTGFCDKVIKKFLRELKEQKILDNGVKGSGLDNKKYYKIDYERLGEIVEKSVFDKACDKGKNTPMVKGKNTPNERGKNTLDEMSKNTLHDKGKNTPNLPILQNQKNTIPKETIPKEQSASADFECANSTFENSAKTQSDLSVKKPKAKKANNSEQNITNAFNAKKSEIYHFTLDDVLEFAKHRDEIKKPITETGAVKIIDKLIKLGIGAYDSIENSITNGWQGLFEPKKINFENSAYARERQKARGELAKKYVTFTLDDKHYNDDDLKALNFQKSNTGENDGDD